MLRKTMLDECKGDKFEELLAAFSSLVLRNRKRTRIVASVKPEQTMPLLLAYRNSLQKNLKVRTEAVDQAKQKIQELDTAIKECERDATRLKHTRRPTVPDNADFLRRLLRESWIGDPVWVDTIVSGIPRPASGDIKQNGGCLPTEEASPASKMQDKLEKHNEKLVEMKRYLQSLQQQKPAPMNQQVASPSKRSKRFTQHQVLHRQVAIPSSTTSMKPQHQALLDSMLAELASETTTTLSLTRTWSTTPTTISHSKRPLPTRAESTVSATSSQSTVVAESEEDLTPIKVRPVNERHITPPDLTPKPMKSLHDRTCASLALYESSQGFLPTSKILDNHVEDEFSSPPIFRSNKASDRTSLLERTRQSMSMLSSVINDNSDAIPLQNRRVSHARSRTAVHIPTQRRRLERAWSEESLSSVATKDDPELDASNYDSVFKSRPKLAMSPNLSPQRSGGDDLWLEHQLEESMNKLTIDSSPEF